MNIISKIVHGSHLFGLNTPDSDMDIKGVFLPDMKDCLLGSAPKHIKLNKGNARGRNTSQDVDEEYYSLQRFVQLLAGGDVTCLDILHARGEHVLETSAAWEFMYDHRKLFYSKQLRSFVRFVFSQTRKYSNRGKRYNSVKEICDYLRKLPSCNKLDLYWDKLPVNEHAHFDTDGTKKPVYKVCGKMVHPTVTVGYALNVFEGYRSLYGERAVQAAQRDGRDLKAISHSMRHLEELDQIVTEGDLTFPIPNRDLILGIKTGRVSVSEADFEKLEERVVEVEKKLDDSDLPDNVDLDFWHKFIVLQYDF